MIVAVLFIGGCECGTPPHPPSDAGPRADAPRDTGGSDGGDAGDVDANLDDAGDVDSGSIDPGSCVFTEADDLYELATDVSPRPRLVSVGPSPAGWDVGYSATVGGLAEVWRVTVPSGAGFRSTTQVTTELATSLDPAVVWSGATFVMSWYSNTDGAFEIYAHAYDPTAPSATQRLTMDAIRQDNPALAVSEAGLARVAWVAQDMAGVRSAFTAELGPTGALVGSAVAVSAPGYTPTQPVLVPRVGGYLMLWGDPTGDVVSVPLDASGAPAAPIIVNTEGTADGSVDVTLGPTGGIVAFGTLSAGIRPEIRVRPIDETGALAGSERILSVGADVGRDASITSLLGGYALAYRALDTNMLRVVFLSLTLDEVARLDIVPIATTGGRTTIRTSGDGALLVGWADQVTPTEIHVRAARIRCN